MTAPARPALGQFGHLDLLAAAIEAQAAPTEAQVLRLASLGRDQLLAVLRRTGPMARLAERAGRRLSLNEPGAGDG